MDQRPATATKSPYRMLAMVRFGIAGFGLHAVKRLMPGFASTEDLSRCPDVDVVLVTTPNAAHVNDVLTAIAAGKHVLCEKPMGMNAEECRRMVEAARKAKLLLGIAHVFRFEETTNRLRERVAAGQIGRRGFARRE